MFSKSSKKGESRLWSGDRFLPCNEPVPKHMDVTLRYADSDDLTASVGAFSWQFRGNGPFDPDVTFVGVQPPAYDQWAALYQRYTVISSSIQVRAISRSVSNCMRVAVAPAADNSAVPSFDALSGFRYSVVGDTTGGANGITLRQRCKTAVVMGTTERSVLDSAQAAFDAAATGLPGQQWFWNIAVETSGSSDSVSLFVIVKYKLRFWRPVTQSTSLTASLLPRRGERRVRRGVTATAVPEKPTELTCEPRGGSRVTDPVIHPGCSCTGCVARAAPLSGRCPDSS